MSITQPSRSHSTRALNPSQRGKKKDEAWRDEDGFVYCQCGEQAITLVVKKEGPNKGRTFLKCGQQSACDVFVWEEDIPKLPVKKDPASVNRESRVYEEPRPPPRSAAAKAAESRARADHAQVASTSPRKRKLLSSDDDEEAMLEMEESPTKRMSRRAISDEEDVIEDVDQGSAKSLRKTDSTGSHQSFSFSTPIKKRERSAGATGNAYDEIREDPNSPFHSMRASLFDKTGSTSTIPETPSSPQLTETQRSTATVRSEGSPVERALDSVRAAMSALEQAKKEEAKRERLHTAAVKERDLLRHDVVEKLRRENTELKGKVKMLEDELEELRVRASRSAK